MVGNWTADSGFGASFEVLCEYTREDRCRGKERRRGISKQNRQLFMQCARSSQGGNNETDTLYLQGLHQVDPSDHVWNGVCEKHTRDGTCKRDRARYHNSTTIRRDVCAVSE